jgi:hypothetical protein
LNAEFDDGDELMKFFGVIKHFNGDVPLDSKFSISIEKFFDYKWNNDRSLAISKQSDLAILEQLP